MGVIDAIADGCFAVARRPILLILPVALDLLYWLGGRLTAAPLIEALIRGAQPGGGAPEGQALNDLRALGADSDLLVLLSLGIGVLVPALDPERVARPWARGVLDTGSWPVVVLSAVALGLLGLLLLACYLCGVAQLARGEPFDPRQIARRAPVCWLRLLGLGAIVAGGVLLLGLPLFVLAALLVAANISPLLPLLLFLAPLAPLYCYLALAPEAIAVSEVGPLRAIKLSFGVARRDFWSLLGLLCATIFLSVGFPYGWQLLTGRVAGVPLAIAGNAFLVTGLTAAAMFFYRARLGEVAGSQEAVGGGR